jgi:hypothetical protein
MGRYLYTGITNPTVVYEENNARLRLPRPNASLDIVHVPRARREERYVENACRHSITPPLTGVDAMGILEGKKCTLS